MLDDRELMENLLVVTKSICGICLHGTVEASTPKVQTTFQESLNDSLSKQSEIYNIMKNNGWYQAENVEPNKIQQTLTKFM